MLWEVVKKGPAQSLSEKIHQPRFIGEKRQMKEHLWINRAHVIMLYEGKLLSRDDTKTLLSTLDKLEKSDISFNPSFEDLYTHIEMSLIQTLGEDVGGRIHTGRSRNDYYYTFGRMKIRKQLNEVCEALLRFITTMLELAREHTLTVMPAYTHGQQAQPITFGHYLLSICEVARRDLVRLENAYLTVNKSPMGAGALATTSFALNRERVSNLLGFDELAYHSLDAITSRDYVLEPACALACISITMSRLFNDLHRWTMIEFGFVDLADEHCTSSSIMPQKRNPVAVEHGKAKAGRINGYLTCIIGLVKDLGTTHQREAFEASQILDEMLEQTIFVITLATEVMRSLRVNKEAMASMLSKGFSTATELADTIVREKDMAFRTAHRIVGQLVLDALEKKISPSEVTETMLDQASEKIIGKPLHLPKESVRRALNPLENVKIRNLPGGPAPEEVLRMIDETERSLGNSRLMLTERRHRIDRAYEDTEHAAQELISSP